MRAAYASACLLKMSRTLLSELAHLINPDAQRAAAGGRGRGWIGRGTERGATQEKIAVVDETWLS